MKTAFFSTAFTVLAAATCVTAAVASPVSDLRDNAAAASANAHIYQWKRVGLEVVRVADAEKKVQASQSSKSEALSSAVRELRSAQATHDSEGVQAAALQVLAASDALSK